MTWTHAIINSSNVMVELVNPDSMTLSVPAGASAISKLTIDAWIVLYGDLNGVCSNFGWTNLTGANPS